MTLVESLRQAGAGLRRARIGRAALPGFVTALVIMAIAAWLLRSGLINAPLLVVAGWLLLLGAVGIAIVAAVRAANRVGPMRVALDLEDGGAWRAGSLTTLLDSPPAGTSSTLHRMALSAQADAVGDRGAAVLEPLVGAELRGARGMLIAAALAGVALILARPMDGAAGLLWRPVSAAGALVQPVTLEADRSEVRRGGEVSFSIVAPGYSRATLRLRHPGEGWRDQEVELDRDGRATVTAGPLDAELVARADAGGRRSGEVRVSIVLPAFVGAFTITAHYPDYLRLESEQLPVDGDTLIVPEGTRLEIAGSSTAELAAVALTSGVDSVFLAVSGRDFSGRFMPAEDREWELAASAAGGVPLAGAMPRFAVRVVADSAPDVSIMMPATDTTAAAAAEVAVVVAAQDDHGIRSMAIELRVAGADRVITMPLDVEAGSGTAQAVVSDRIRLGSLQLVAGDTVYYHAVAVDDSPRRQRGRSAERRIIIPTGSELRAAAVEDAARNSAALDSLVSAARQAQRQAEDLARQRLDAGAGENEGTLSSETAQRVEQAAAAQEAIEERLSDAVDQLEQLERRAAEAGVLDSALAGQMAEIRDLLERAVPPELRAAMNELREAMRQLDGDRAGDALKEMARQQERMRQAMEQARELFERAALEMDLANLADEAGELSALQERLAEQLKADSAGAAARQEEAAERAEALAEALERATERMPVTEGREGMQQAADRARQASSEMQSAAESSEQGDPEMAVSQAESAGETMSEAEEQIRKERGEMQQGMRREVIDALDRLLAETASIVRQQQQVAETFRRGALSGQLRIEQATLEEATARLLQQSIAVASKNALTSPRIAAGFTGARDAMRAAIEATSSAVPSPGTAADRAGNAIDGLAVAAWELLRSRDNISGGQSGSGMAEAMQQMQQMAGQQGGMSQQGQSMMDDGGTPSMAEMMQLAMQQRAIAQQLELMQAGGNMPGAGAMADEAGELSRMLESGRLDREMVERQQRLFRRMLDAGRSLQGEEEDREKERRSEAADPARRAAPPVFDPRSLRTAGDIPLPRWEDLQRLSPDERRRAMDYFRRLAEGGTP